MQSTVAVLKCVCNHSMKECHRYVRIKDVGMGLGMLNCCEITLCQAARNDL